MIHMRCSFRQRLAEVLTFLWVEYTVASVPYMQISSTRVHLLFWLRYADSSTKPPCRLLSLGDSPIFSGKVSQGSAAFVVQGFAKHSKFGSLRKVFVHFKDVLVSWHLYRSGIG